MESTFRKDVMDDIAWERDNINKQLEMLEPMTKELHRSSGLRFLSKTGYVFTEMIVWVLILVAIAWLAFLFKVPPFYIISDLTSAFESVKGELYSQTIANNVAIFEWSIRGLVALIIVLLFIVARQLAKLRSKVDITQMAGKTIKDIKQKLEERLTQLKNLEDKYQYLLVNDAKIEPDGFTNPLPPPDGDEVL